MAQLTLSLGSIYPSLGASGAKKAFFFFFFFLESPIFKAVYFRPKVFIPKHAPHPEIYVAYIFKLVFSHLADAFIQSDL